MEKWHFLKVEATGNDFLLLEKNPQQLSTAQRRALCDRHRGIGADGLLWLEVVSLVPSARMGTFRMLYWNADGELGTFCGNGARAALWWAHMRYGISSGILLAADGAHEAHLLQTEPPLISVQLTVHQAPRPVDKGRWFVHTGSPHLLLEAPLAELPVLPVERVAPPLRWDTTLDPKGVNVSFFAQAAEGAWHLRTYERGVEAETLSCGTACVALAALSGEKEIRIHTAGGEITVRRENEMTFWLQGSVRLIAEGTYFPEKSRG